ncbi:MAG: hypothetical protein V1755_06825 [Chloroflexota bacterium]
MRSLEACWREQVLGTSGVLVVAREEPEPCPACGGPMQVQKTMLHTGKTIRHGTFQVRETVRVCAAQCRESSGSLVTRRPQSVIEQLLPNSMVGYDVMVLVGRQRFLHHRQREEIRRDLFAQHGIDLSTGEVSRLARLFLQYLETLHEARIAKMRETIATDGGYPLHIDATGEDGKGTLLVALAGWRRWVLDAWKVPTEHADLILPALRSVVERFGPPCAIMRDLGKPMISAAEDLVEELDEEVRLLSCHLHFVRDVGKDLLDSPHGELRERFRQHKIRPGLAALARDLGRKLGEDVAEARKDLRAWQGQEEEGHKVPEGKAGLATVRALAQWVLDYHDDGNDQGFPFDRPYHDLHERCVTARRAVDAFWRTPPEDEEVCRALNRLGRVLEPIVRERLFVETAQKLRQRAGLLDELRQALRLVPKSGGRNAVAPLPARPVPEAIAELNDIQTAVKDLVASLKQRRPERGPAQDLREAIDTILAHLQTHGESLWGHVVSLSTPDGKIIRIVDRTNNILEGAFGDIKQGERRRSGRKILTQDFENLPAAAALTRNLNCPDYVTILCGSLDRLDKAFAQLDADRRAKKLAGTLPTPLGRSHNPIPEVATASLPAADRPLVRTDGMRRRIFSAARSRAPRMRPKWLRTAMATAD